MTPRDGDARERAPPATHIREDALTRVMRRARERAERRRDKVYAQEGEPLWKTLGRVLFVSACVLVDGVVLIEIVRVLDRTALAWALYALALFVAVTLQMKAYKRWFDVTPRA